MGLLSLLQKKLTDLSFLKKIIVIALKFPKWKFFNAYEVLSFSRNNLLLGILFTNELLDERLDL